MTLVELVVALAVLAVALSALVALLLASVRANRSATIRQDMHEIAAAAVGRWQAGDRAGAACAIPAELAVRGARCQLEERGCLLSDPIHCSAEVVDGAVVEAAVTVSLPAAAPLVVRSLRARGGGGE